VHKQFAICRNARLCCRRFFGLHESCWPPTGWAIVPAKYRNCWLIFLHTPKFSRRECEKPRRLWGKPWCQKTDM
jgi:hypothetical protein